MGDCHVAAGGSDVGAPSRPVRNGSGGAVPSLLTRDMNCMKPRSEPTDFGSTGTPDRTGGDPSCDRDCRSLAAPIPGGGHCAKDFGAVKPGRTAL